MEQKRILELALETLEIQKAAIDAELAAIRAELDGVSPAFRAPRSVASAGTRRKTSRIPAGHKTQSQRMKEYWAAKRAQAPKNRPLARAKGRMKTEAEKKALSIKMKEAWNRRKAEADGAGAAQEIEAASKEQEA